MQFSIILTTDDQIASVHCSGWTWTPIYLGIKDGGRGLCHGLDHILRDIHRLINIYNFLARGGDNETRRECHAHPSEQIWGSSWEGRHFEGGPRHAAAPPRPASSGSSPSSRGRCLFPDLIQSMHIYARMECRIIHVLFDWKSCTLIPLKNTSISL